MDPPAANPLAIDNSEATPAAPWGFDVYLPMMDHAKPTDRLRRALK